MSKFEAQEINLDYEKIQKLNSKLLNIEDFLLFLKNNINLKNDYRILDMYCGEFNRFRKYHDQGIKVYIFENRKEKFENYFEDEFTKIGNHNEIPWEKEFFDCCIFDGFNINLEFETHQIILSEIARVLKKNSYLLLKVRFEHNDYFRNNFININKNKDISIDDFSFRFSYCQSKRLLEPFFKILEFSPTESRDNQLNKNFFWNIICRKV
tara:strand:- start:284 stop:913 length:630 start_codon:yes stop_codon:yes gene_type:complete